MTREEAALGQLRERFLNDRTRGFVLNGVPQPPISRAGAEAAWNGAEARFTAALKVSANRSRFNLDGTTPETEVVILPVIPADEETRIHNEESARPDNQPGGPNAGRT